MLQNEMIEKIVRTLDSKRAEDIQAIEIKDLTILADYFIIASGSNRNQLQALSDEVEERLGRKGYPPKQIEGYEGASWILLDFGDIIVHLFDQENRIFYDLERIWRDGKQIDAEELKENQ